MRSNIHPQVYTDAKVTCVCGANFATTSTKQNITVEICSNCHPFYTGQQKFVDTEGRIDKFAKKLKLSEAKAKAVADIKSTKKDKKTGSKQSASKVTLKEILESSKDEATETKSEAESKKSEE